VNLATRILLVRRLRTREAFLIRTLYAFMAFAAMTSPDTNKDILAVSC